MPTSFWNHIPRVIDFVRAKQPQSILEIGCGFGKWGHLFREYLEVYGYCRTDKERWTTRLDAIEIFSKYINEATRYYYDTIYIGNALQKIDSLEVYDLIVLMDVLEHFTKEDGQLMLAKIKDKCKNFILSVPLGDWIYTHDGENTHESHISIWNEEELVTKDCVNHTLYPVNDKFIGVFYYEKSK